MTGGTGTGLRASWPLYLGMAVAGAAALVASASTLAGLARTAGWAGWTPWLLPAALDVGGSVGGWCWLRPTAPPLARDFGRVVALVGAGGTLVGNGAGHLIASGYLHPSPLLVVTVGAVPAAVLVTLAHLAALLAVDPEPAAELDSPVTAVERPAAEDLDVEPQLSLPLALEAPAPTTNDTADTRAAVLDELHRSPATIAELVRSTGRSRTTIVGHLTALTDDGSITRDDAKRYRPVTRPHAVQG